MSSVLIFIQASIFFILSAIHFNWVFGGNWGFDNALPTNAEGKRVLNPTRIDSAVVAVGLLLFASFYLIKGEFLKIDLPNWISAYLGWVISSIFMLRAIGDFKYAGFFKRIRTGNFAKYDTQYYSPLCLILAIIGLLLELI